LGQVTRARWRRKSSHGSARPSQAVGDAAAAAPPAPLAVGLEADVPKSTPAKATANTATALAVGTPTAPPRLRTAEDALRATRHAHATTPNQKRALVLGLLLLLLLLLLLTSSPLRGGVGSGVPAASASAKA